MQLIQLFVVCVSFRFQCVYKLLLLFFKVNNDQNKEFELF